MNKKITLVLFIIILCFETQAQIIKIKDSENEKPLESVFVVNQNTGALLSESNRNGIAEIKIKSDSLNVSLIRMGYERLDTILLRGENEFVFEMHETLIDLNVFTVTSTKPTKPKKEKYPLERKKSRVWKHIGKHMNGDLILPKINEKYPEVYLSEISLKLGNWGKDKTINTRPFRIRFFENENGYPGKEIGEYNFLPKRKKHYKMDFRKQWIKIPEEGVFVFFQMVTGEKGELRVELRKGMKGRWTKVAKENAKFRLDNKVLKINMGYKLRRYQSE